MEKWQCQAECELKKKHKMKAKGFNTVIEELKQRISAKTLKLKRYKSRAKQYRQNRTFRNNQKISLKRMFPYIFGKCQIGKRQALMNCMDSG